MDGSFHMINPDVILPRPTASLQRAKTHPPMSVLDMTLNNLMVRLL